MKSFILLTSVLSCMTSTSTAFTSSLNVVKGPMTSSDSSPSQLFMANDEDLLRWARASRSAGADDNVVELNRPLGLVLNEDESGNVYVETVAPNGNAARTGQVQEGDIVTMCSATFGDDMWSTRGVGLSRVLAAIRVRAGATVKLVLETPDQYKKKATITTKQKAAMEEAKKQAQAKKDELLQELEKDEKKLSKKFFRLW